MADHRKPYTVVLGRSEHTLLLTEDDAKRYDAKPAGQGVKAAKSVQNKADKTAENKAG